MTSVSGWDKQRLGSEGVVFGVTQTLKAGHGEYSVAQLGIPGLRHFVYKSRAHVQVTLPRYEDPYDDLQERRRCVLRSAFSQTGADGRRVRLFTIYQTINDAIHAKSGQEETLKLQYIRTEKESVMGWVSTPSLLQPGINPKLIDVMLVCVDRLRSRSSCISPCPRACRRARSSVPRTRSRDG